MGKTGVGVRSESRGGDVSDVQVYDRIYMSNAQCSDLQPCVTAEDEELRQGLISLLTFVLEPDEPTDEDVERG